MILCLSQAGVGVLLDSIKELTAKACIKNEKKLKFKSNALIFILKLFDSDVTKVLQFAKNQDVKKKALKKAR